MAAELRWILLGLCLPLLAGIWWWTARRVRRAPGDAQLRESNAGKPAEAIPALDPRYADPDDEDMAAEPEPRDWGVPPFEPLNIHTADFDRVPVLDGPMMVNVDRGPLAATPRTPAWVHVSRTVPVMVAPETAMSAAAEPAGSLAAEPAMRALAESATPAIATPAAVKPAMPAARVPVTAAATMPVTPPAEVPPSVRPTASTASVDSGRFAAVAPAPQAAELQRIVTVRVCAVGEVRWPGTQLMAALELHGLAFGRYQVFHRKHVDGRSLFCAASLVEPGIFDVAEMANQEFRGVTLFAVLPGPMEPLETVDELFGTARGLAEELSGMVQDSKGMPLSPQRAAAMREDVAHFQAVLPRN